MYKITKEERCGRFDRTSYHRIAQHTDLVVIWQDENCTIMEHESIVWEWAILFLVSLGTLSACLWFKPIVGVIYNIVTR